MKKQTRFILILIGVAILLLIPFLAMQFSEEVNWTGSDFLMMGVLLLGAGLSCEMVLRKVTKAWNRTGFCLGILIFLIIIWAEIAVGIFGTPLAGS